MEKKYVLKSHSKGIDKINDKINYKINYENQLNPAQFEAVSSIEGNYLVIAGAGTGKTRTLVFRVARLVEMGYNPQSILLLTFTRKAAREMMNRAELLLDNRCGKVNGGTFHSFANITLRKFSNHIGLNSNFIILDQGDSEDVINLIKGQMKLGELKKRFPNKQTLYKIFSLSTNMCRPLDDIVIQEYPHFSLYLQEMRQIKNVYENYKKKSSLLDYDDLLIYLRDFLWKFSPAAQSLLNSINFVMVDEYQDTNKLQAEVVQGLTQLNNNLMVVGDDSQSIYSFRGANFKNIIEFPKLFKDVKVITLEENYRSTQPILDFTNQIIESAIEKYPKHLFTHKQSGVLPVIIKAATENMQSRFIVERILELREEGLSLNDFAVLFRSSFFSFDLEIELTKANIPFKKFGGMKFIETAHVKDMLAFLRISANPKDFVSWYRVLLLHEGIGPKKAQTIIDDFATGRISLETKPDAIVNPLYNDHILNLLYLLQDIHKKKLTPSEKIESILQYYEPFFMDKYDDFNKRKKDLEIFLNISQNYRSVDSFLADMALEPPQDTVIDIEAEMREEEFLTLSTIHSAKGLEWNTIFIIHALEGFFPSSMSCESADQLEEERRLMYVAATRAKQNLYITYPEKIFDRYNGITFAKPSRFLRELHKDLSEQWVLEDKTYYKY
ncbi:MAG: UvrD-helicase domain-containing protein [Ignavibacteriales bacterium]|nr:UvrD-helicase domain-containing protein [Ignavibacteriales bacterium]